MSFSHSVTGIARNKLKPLETLFALCTAFSLWGALDWLTPIRGVLYSADYHVCFSVLDLDPLGG